MRESNPLPPEQRKRVTRLVVIAVVISDLIIFGLIGYYFLMKPSHAPAGQPAPGAETRK